MDRLQLPSFIRPPPDLGAPSNLSTPPLDLSTATTGSPLWHAITTTILTPPDPCVGRKRGDLCHLADLDPCTPHRIDTPSLDSCSPMPDSSMGPAPTPNPCFLKQRTLSMGSPSPLPLAWLLLLTRYRTPASELRPPPSATFSKEKTHAAFLQILTVLHTIATRSITCGIPCAGCARPPNHRKIATICWDYWPIVGFSADLGSVANH
ncbi:hypothetical protein COCNU_scaffold012454G000020 [Cocos nucifera]|nr:hypothetical protein [Cocos nucifera]